MRKLIYVASDLFVNLMVQLTASTPIDDDEGNGRGDQHHQRDPSAKPPSQPTGSYPPHFAATVAQAAESGLSIAEPITDTTNGEDRRRVPRASKLTTQIADIDIHDIGSGIVLVAPYGTQQLLA